VDGDHQLDLDVLVTEREQEMRTVSADALVLSGASTWFRRMPLVRWSSAMFFGARRFGRMGPLSLAFAGYRMWQRLSPQQKQAVRARATQVAAQLRSRRQPPGAPR
jgi:hypothetical protein